MAEGGSSSSRKKCLVKDCDVVPSNMEEHLAMVHQVRQILPDSDELEQCDTFECLFCGNVQVYLPEFKKHMLEFHGMLPDIERPNGEILTWRHSEQQPTLS